MGARERENVLLRLQDSLMAGEPRGASSAMALPFQVGSATFALAFSEVQRVQLASGMVALARYPHAPQCVIGVSAADAEMLTVVDAGLLLGHGRVHHTMKSRMVVLGDGPMKGFGLLVSRVLELIELSALGSVPDCARLTANMLSESLRARATVPKDSQP